jgi:hypothetical protein
MSTTEHDTSEVVADLYTEAAKLKGVESINATDWDAVEDCLRGSERSGEYAEALAQTWADHRDEPHFDQPSGTLVDLVIDISGDDPFADKEEQE